MNFTAKIYTSVALKNKKLPSGFLSESLSSVLGGNVTALPLQLVPSLQRLLTGFLFSLLKNNFSYFFVV